MKLKYKFVVREIDGNPVAVAVGKDSAHFHGMIKLNPTGAFIFRMLSEETDGESIISAIAEKYGITREIAAAEVTDFTDRLRDSGLLEG